MPDLTLPDLKDNEPPRTVISLMGAPVISIVTLLIFLIALIIAYIMKNETLVTAMLGVAAANATTVVNFWLGSSSGSHGKDATISQQGQIITRQAERLSQ